VRSRKKSRNTPLYVASRYGFADLTESLLSHGADINLPDEEGRTPLYWASLSGHVDIARLLLSHGADVNARTKSGATPLHAACKFPASIDIVRLLLEAGADVNARNIFNSTALHHACGNGDARIARLLLERGAAPDVRNHKGDRAFDLKRIHLFQHKDHAEVIDLFRQHAPEMVMEAWCTQEPRP